MKPTKSPFYNQKTSTLFDNLWFPTSDNFHQLKSTILRGFSKKNNVTSKIYLSKHAYKKSANKLRNKFPTNNFDDNMVASRKIRIFPDYEYIKRFNVSIGANRYMYNKTVAAINETYGKAKKHFDELKKSGCIFIDKTKKQCCKPINNTYFCRAVYMFLFIKTYKITRNIKNPN
ncbi:hypothetical protein EON71_01280 [bacterium]|nr:MAG: hypothetical protein EON71_01280 [bacterium]